MPPILPDNAPVSQPDNAPVSLGNITLGIYESGKRSGSLWQRRPLDIIVADYIRGDALSGVTEGYRNRLAADGKDAARPLKEGQFPAVTLAGVFPGARKGNDWPIRHTGLYQCDIDGLTPAQAAELQARAAELAFVALAFVSPSFGLKVIARGAPAADKADQRRQWEGANRAVCGGLGLDFDGKADPAVKGVNGLCFLCYDAGAHYNPDAIPLPPVAPAPARKRGRKPAAAAAPPDDAAPDDGEIAKELAYIQQSLPAAGQNTYPDFLAVCGALKELGRTESEVAAWAEGTARGLAEYTWESLPAASGEAGSIIRRIAGKWRRRETDFPFWLVGLDREAYGPWEVCLAGDAIRFLRYNAPNILLADRGRKHRRVFLDMGYGVWTDKSDALHQTINATRQIWGHSALDHAPANKLGAIARYVRSAATPTKSDEVLTACGTEYQDWLHRVAWEEAPPELNAIPDDQVCLLRDMDSKTRYLGAPNGVIDLDTGELLTGPAARATLTSRQILDDYNPDAQSPAVDRLFGHIPDTEREWLFSALGHALRGYPNRRLYLITGPAGAGKSTMLQAVAGALGDCGGELSVAALREKRDGANQPEAMGLQLWRVAVITEPPGAGAFSESRIRAASGGDAIPLRMNYANDMMAGRTTATMFWACNPDNIPQLALQQKALFDRLRVLQYPALPDGAKDETLAVQLAQPLARQAIVALLVKAAVANPTAPADIPSVAAARAALRTETVGEAGQYLLAAVIPEAGRRLGTTELWDAACAYAGQEGATEIWGYGRREFTNLAKSLLELGFTRTIRRQGQAQKGWTGYRLATGFELEQRLAAANDDGLSLPAWCILCGRELPACALAQVETLPVSDAGVTAGFCPECWPPDALRQRLYRMLAGQCLLWLFADGQEAAWSFDAPASVAQAIYGMRIAALDSVYSTLQEGAGDWRLAMQAAMRAAIDAAPELPVCLNCGERATAAQLDNRGNCGNCRRGPGPRCDKCGAPGKLYPLDQRSPATGRRLAVCGDCR